MITVIDYFITQSSPEPNKNESKIYSTPKNVTSVVVNQSKNETRTPSLKTKKKMYVSWNKH